MEKVNPGKLPTAARHEVCSSWFARSFMVTFVPEVGISGTFLLYSQWKPLPGLMEAPKWKRINVNTLHELSSCASWFTWRSWGERLVEMCLVLMCWCWVYRAGADRRSCLRWTSWLTAVSPRRSNTWCRWSNHSFRETSSHCCPER